MRKDVCIALADEVAKGNKVGLDVTTGEALIPPSRVSTITSTSRRRSCIARR